MIPKAHWEAPPVPTTQRHSDELIKPQKDPQSPPSIYLSHGHSSKLKIQFPKPKVVPTPGTTWDNVMELFQASTRMPPLDGMKFISDLLLSICRDDLLSNKELMAKLRGAKYDIVLLDWFFSCGQVIDKLIKPRFPAVRLHVSVAHPLMTEWHHGYDNTVLPGSPLAFSFQMGTSFHSPESTFLDRAANAFTYVLTSVLLRGAYYEPYAKLMLEFGAKDTVIDDVMNLVCDK